MAKDYLLSLLSDDAGGVQYANTVCVHDDELGGPRPGSEIMDDIDSWLTTKYVNLLPNTITLRVLRLFQIPDVYGDDSNVYLASPNQLGALTAGDGKLPREMTLTMSFRSSHSSRRTMGHISLPSPQNSGNLTGSGNWNTAGDFWIACGTFGAALLAGKDIGIAGVDGHLSTRVYSRRQHKLGTGDKTVDITSYTRRPRPRWLRRRTSAP